MISSPSNFFNSKHTKAFPQDYTNATIGFHNFLLFLQTQAISLWPKSSNSISFDQMTCFQIASSFSRLLENFILASTCLFCRSQICVGLSSVVILKENWLNKSKSTAEFFLNILSSWALWPTNSGHTEASPPKHYTPVTVGTTLFRLCNSPSFCQKWVKYIYISKRTHFYSVASFIRWSLAYFTLAWWCLFCRNSFSSSVNLQFIAVKHSCDSTLKLNFLMWLSHSLICW